MLHVSGIPLPACLSLMDLVSGDRRCLQRGCPNEITIQALAELVIEMTGSSSSITYILYGEAYEPGFEDMDRRLPDVAKIGRLTGWAPTFSLRHVLEDGIEYQRDPAGFRPRPVPEARSVRATH